MSGLQRSILDLRRPIQGSREPMQGLGVSFGNKVGEQQLIATFGRGHSTRGPFNG